MTKPLKLAAELALMGDIALSDDVWDIIIGFTVITLLTGLLLLVIGHHRGKFNWRSGKWYPKGKRIKRGVKV